MGLLERVGACQMGAITVSYTHLDVYKRQLQAYGAADWRDAAEICKGFTVRYPGADADAERQPWCGDVKRLSLIHIFYADYTVLAV